MSRDERWRDTVGTWDRLKWARLRKFETAKDAAASLGLNENTYRAYEREPGSSKHSKLDHVHAGHFAKRFGVRWEWLLTGDGVPWRDTDERREKILEAFDEATDDRKDAVADAIVRLLRAS